MRIILTLAEQMEIKYKRIAKIQNALNDVYTLENIVKNTCLKNTKDILYEQMKKAIKM